MIHKRVLKYIKDKKCPECDALGIEIILEVDDSTGVAFETQFESCCECEYYEKIKISEKRYIGDLGNYNPKFD